MSLTPHTHGFPQDIIFLGLLDNHRQSAPVRSRSALHECPDALLSSIHTFICFIRLIINSYVHSFIRSAHPFVHSSFWSEYIIRPTSHDAIYNNYKTLKVQNEKAPRSFVHYKVKYLGRFFANKERIAEQRRKRKGECNYYQAYEVIFIIIGLCLNSYLKEFRNIFLLQIIFHFLSSHG